MLICHKSLRRNLTVILVIYLLCIPPLIKSEAIDAFNQGLQPEYSLWDIVYPLDIKVDKHIIPVGQKSEVTVTVFQENSPLTGQSIDIWGHCSGITDDNGQFRAILEPGNHEDIVIDVGGYGYSGILFALEEDQGILEVMAQDIYGKDMDYFLIDVTGKDIIWRAFAQGNIARAICRAGHNYIDLVYVDYDNDVSYYIYQEMSLIPGQITKVNIDSSSAVERILRISDNIGSFELEDIYVARLDTEYTHQPMYRYIGNYNFQGQRRIYMTEGIGLIISHQLP